MLRCYPIISTHENWLHESLLEMIHSIHMILDAGNQVPDWVDLIPVGLNHSNASSLKRLHGFKNRFELYINSVNSLPTGSRQYIYSTMTSQNNIAGLVQGVTYINRLSKRFADVFSAVDSLFDFAYEKLTDLEIRDRQYRIIIDSFSPSICPVCGIDRINSPAEARQDLDHYLAKSIYPFAAANLCNLIPMCSACNRTYKHKIDVLIDANKKRRKAYDPYNAPGVAICLNESIPFGGTGSTLPAWTIKFSPASEESETWDQVFCIRLRYSRYVLNSGFNRWISSFMNKCRSNGYSTALSNEEVLDILIKHELSVQYENPVGIDFLKPQVFRMLIEHFRSGNARVIQFIRDATVGI